MKEFDRLVDIVKKLHGPQGCPWDKKQTIKDYKSYLIEEVYECVDSIASKDTAKVQEELGDLMLLIVTVSHLYAQQGDFTVRDSLNCVNEKLVSRHPHVFTKQRLRSAEQVLKQWYGLKFRQRKNERHFAHIPAKMPSLMKGYKAAKESFKRGLVTITKRQALKEFKHTSDIFSTRPTKRRLQEVLFSLVQVCALYSYEPEVSFLDFLRRKFKI